jgi:hypothetical protein
MKKYPTRQSKSCVSGKILSSRLLSVFSPWLVRNFFGAGGWLAGIFALTLRRFKNLFFAAEDYTTMCESAPMQIHYSIEMIRRGVDWRRKGDRLLEYKGTLFFFIMG